MTLYQGQMPTKTYRPNASKHSAYGLVTNIPQLEDQVHLPIGSYKSKYPLLPFYDRAGVLQPYAIRSSNICIIGSDDNQLGQLEAQITNSFVALSL